jgi:NTP pyrophosphatase (non-canonical NTP hydrolase)
MKISEAQTAVDRYIGQFAEGYWPPLSNLARLIEEVGELARELNHRYGHKTKKLLRESCSDPPPHGRFWFSPPL